MPSPVLPSTLDSPTCKPTGTVAKVASLIAIVIGGYQFAHGEPGAKKALVGVAFNARSIMHDIRYFLTMVVLMRDKGVLTKGESKNV
jgi:hypothetical protein